MIDIIKDLAIKEPYKATTFEDVYKIVLSLPIRAMDKQIFFDRYKEKKTMRLIAKELDVSASLIGKRIEITLNLLRNDYFPLLKENATLDAYIDIYLTFDTPLTCLPFSTRIKNCFAVNRIKTVSHLRSCLKKEPFEIAPGITQTIDLSSVLDLGVTSLKEIITYSCKINIITKKEIDNDIIITANGYKKWDS